MIGVVAFGPGAERSARLAHEARRSRQTLPDPAWEELDERLREMKRSQVADIPRKLDAAGYALVEAGDPMATPMQLSHKSLERLSEMEHDRWCMVKRAQGWRYGDRLDPAAMAHPSLVPFALLSEQEKEKDREMVRRIPEQLSALGFAVRPL